MMRPKPDGSRSGMWPSFASWRVWPSSSMTMGSSTSSPESLSPCSAALPHRCPLLDERSWSFGEVLGLADGDEPLGTHSPQLIIGPVQGGQGDLATLPHHIGRASCRGRG